MPRADVPVTFDPDGLLWQLADVTDSKDPNLRFNHRLELEPPSREARSPVQSRRGREREELARTWHWPPAPAPPSLPSSSTWLPPVPPVPPPPPPPPPPRRVLAPVDPNIVTLALELRALERQHAALKQHALRQQRAIRALADLGNRCAPLF